MHAVVWPSTSLSRTLSLRATSRVQTPASTFESTGGINERQLFRFAAKREGVQLSVYCGRAWARLACNLQSSVAQAILNRMCGVGVGVYDDLTFVW